MINYNIMTHFISFGGPAPRYYRALNRICMQATETKIFDTVTGYTDLDLKKDKKFWKEHGKFISRHGRGYGYWLWKPYLILKRLNEIKDGELLFYTDAGSDFNPKASSDFMTKRFDEVRKTKKLMGIFTCPEKNFNKIDLVKYFGYENSPFFLKSRQHAAGAILIMKTPEIIKFITEWYELGYKDNYHFIDDSRSKEKETEHFKKHRHDQSIFSLLTKKYDIMLPTSLRGFEKGAFFRTLRKKAGPLLTEETNLIGIDIKKANSGYKDPKLEVKKIKSIDKDVTNIVNSKILNENLTIKSSFNTLFGDIAMKKKKYLHIEYLSSSGKIENYSFKEDAKIRLLNIKQLKSAIYTTNPKFSNLKLNSSPKIVSKKEPINIIVKKNSTDVTDKLSKYLKNNILSFNENYNKYFSDVDYGKKKFLIINYTDLNKSVKKVIFKENEFIHIENILYINNSIYKS